MRCITITNIPEDLYQELIHSAQRNRRNMNRELLVCLHTAVQVSKQQQATSALPPKFRTKSQNPSLAEKYLHAAMAEAIEK